ncbi:class I SAM-dependent methyltransferase [Sphaerisporangium album]|uniref:Class I SAM-dependent methyltransferase n=1 Tax=Sphaerisporangium album TaxID=509200 RepID=A0A367FIE6_9ACTN|nr:class I SAM-dependent methyltransferase [Sphaerisporangium album]RCG30074.1 class I SAM-dependent methyltransferase [Sphaerisporangium album]
METIANTHHAEAWNGWEGEHWARNPSRYNGIMSGFDDRLFEAAAIGERDSVLDVGCGTGYATLVAARRASRGHVVGVDLSAPMLERARADAAGEGVGNVRFERGDAQVHPFPDGAFDVVISRGGVMFFADPVAAFANIRRALRPGGRMAFLGPRGGDPDAHYSRATAALAPLMRGPSPAARGMGSLVDPARIREVLDASGFTGVEITPVDALMNYGSDAADAADFILGMGPVRFNLQDAGEDVLTRTRAGLRAGLLSYETAEGVMIPGAVWVVSAVRP